MQDHRAALPSVPPVLAEHSAAVVAHLVERVCAAGGAVPFSEYMQLALYAPGLGYYASGTHKFGADGDFTTAPEISPLFGAVIAQQCMAVLESLGGGIVVEYGAGTGKLACDVLEAMIAAGAPPTRYYIVEISADLQARQQALIADALPDALALVEWVEDPAVVPVDGVIIGNEVIDALPVERFRVHDDGQIQQQVVRLDAAAPVLAWQPASAVLVDAVQRLQSALGRTLPIGYVSELCLQLPAWLQLVAHTLQRGVVLFSDYGYGRKDYYAPDRTSGTLTCHYRHHMHDDVLFVPGGQDITAWVDFSTVAETLRDCGLHYLGFTTQAQFLLHGGLPQALEAAGGEDTLALSRGVKTLTLPGEMGERFRFMGFARDCDVMLSGFSGRDFGFEL
ncbi:MAG: SAM-dependent methyltransferase [Pseudomonadota bacterium]